MDFLNTASLIGHIRITENGSVTVEWMYHEQSSFSKTLRYVVIGLPSPLAASFDVQLDNLVEIQLDLTECYQIITKLLLLGSRDGVLYMYTCIHIFIIRSFQWQLYEFDVYSVHSIVLQFVELLKVDRSLVSKCTMNEVFVPILLVRVFSHFPLSLQSAINQGCFDNALGIMASPLVYLISALTNKRIDIFSASFIWHIALANPNFVFRLVLS